MTEQEERRELMTAKGRFLDRLYTDLLGEDVMDQIERYEILITLTGINAVLGGNREVYRGLVVWARERI